jgi:hypothetical protein
MERSPIQCGGAAVNLHRDDEVLSDVIAATHSGGEINEALVSAVLRCTREAASFRFCIALHLLFEQTARNPITATFRSR